MWRYDGHNRRPFSALTDNHYGRRVIYTNQNNIDGTNILEELGKAIGIHNQNAMEIEYLDRYYRGDCPILYRKKDVRPEVNNKIVENIAQFIVETKTSAMVGEPVQYVLRGTDKAKSEQIANLNTIMESEDKAYYDVSLCRWRSICGTAYRFVGNDDNRGSLLDESVFYFESCDPMKTFVVYYNNDKPAFSVQIYKNESDKYEYFIYTNTEYFVTDGKEILDSGRNGNGAIPVVEYPNNERRISDIELTISMTDEINRMASDRANGIEQFVSSWIKFINCDIDAETFKKMRMEGALVVKSNNGAENKADVDVMTSELNQTESQVAVEDTYEKLLVIQGIANRQTSSSGDTGSAVRYRDGWIDSDARAKVNEPIFKRSERMALRLILNRLRITDGFTLVPSDVEIHIARSMNDNLLTKSEALQMLLASGIKPERAIKTIGLFSDPEQVAVESRKRMEVLYPEKVEKPVINVVQDDTQVNNNQNEEVNANGQPS